MEDGAKVNFHLQSIIN